MTLEKSCSNCRYLSKGRRCQRTMSPYYSEKVLKTTLCEKWEVSINQLKTFLAGIREREQA